MVSGPRPSRSSSHISSKVVVLAVTVVETAAVVGAMVLVVVSPWKVSPRRWPCPVRSANVWAGSRQTSGAVCKPPPRMLIPSRFLSITSPTITALTAMFNCTTVSSAELHKMKQVVFARDSLNQTVLHFAASQFRPNHPRSTRDKGKTCFSMQTKALSTTLMQVRPQARKYIITHTFTHAHPPTRGSTDTPTCARAYTHLHAGRGKK